MLLPNHSGATQLSKQKEYYFQYLLQKFHYIIGQGPIEKRPLVPITLGVNVMKRFSL
jgi:hypothetical protein